MLRYYSTKSYWTFAFSRHVINSGSEVVLVRDDGSKYSFRSDSGYIAPRGFNGELKYITDNNTPSYYELKLPNGDTETYSNSGWLQKIVTYKGYTTTVTPVDNNRGVDINDGFGHTVRLENDMQNKKLSITLPNNQVIVYQYSNVDYRYDLMVYQNMYQIESVTYPNGRKVRYTYQAEASPSPLPILKQISNASNQIISSWVYNGDNHAISNDMHR